MSPASAVRILTEMEKNWGSSYEQVTVVNAINAVHASKEQFKARAHLKLGSIQSHHLSLSPWRMKE